MMTKRIFLARFVVATMAIAVAHACLAATAEIPEGFTHVRTDRDISEYRLDSNGLTVLLLPDHSAPAVTFMVTYHVGSRNESYGTTGATHLLEHLMFKGTRDHNREAGNGYDQLLERTGAITNATTSLDRTNYFETVGSQDLGLAVQLEADRMRNLRLREDDRRPEMTVVRNEYERGENNPAQALEKEVWAAAYIAHPYHHPTIGWHSDFEKVSIDKLRNFYNTFYWPNNATVTIIGDFDPDNALRLVKKYYGAISRSPQPIPDIYTEEPPQTGPRRVIVHRPGELGVVMIAQKIPPATSPDYPALRVLGMILSDGRNSRFYKALTDNNLTTNVDAYPEFNHDPSLFFVVAQLTPGTQHADVEHKILHEIERVQNDGVTSHEVAAAIAKYAANTAYERDGSMSMAFALNECIAAGDWRLYYQLVDAVKRVTPADVQRVAKKYFNEDQRTTGWYVPRNKKSVGLHSSVANINTGGAESAPHTAAKPEAVNSPKLAAVEKTAHNSAPASRSVASSETDQSNSAAAPAAKIAPRIVRTRTDGLDLLICPTGVKDVVTIKGSFPAFDPTNPVVGEFTADMLDRGTTLHDADTIAMLLDKVGAQIQFGYRSGNFTFAAECLKKDSAQVIGLLAEQLSKPRFPADEFDKVQKQELAAAQQSRQETEAQAAIAFCRAVFPVGHPQYRLTSDEKISALQKVTVANVKAFHHRFFGPNDCTMVVVGDVEPAAIQKQVSKAFADWKGGRPLPHFPAPNPLEHAKNFTVQVPGKASVTVIMGAPSGVRYSDADYLPLAVGTSVLGHGFTSRLLGTVRDVEGLTYGIGAELTGTGRLRQTWLVSATFAPSLLKRGLASTHRELVKWQRDGITEAELNYRKSALAGAHRVSLATSGGLASSILETVRRGLDLSWIDDYPKKVDALTLSQVNSVIRHRIDPDKLVTAEAGTIKHD
ncbi:MAG TPA: pitrilysin family protein [Lacipirellulaceae bacterium]|nr:pitrilysin family protein [Lacipirellulaceae bacterium]